MVIFSWKLFFNCLNYSLVSLFCVYFDLFHTINDTGSHILLKNYFPLFFVLSIKIGSILPRTFYRVPFHSFLTLGMLFWSQSSRGMPFGSQISNQLTCIYFHNWLDSTFFSINLPLLWILHQNFCFFIFRYLPPSTIICMRCWIFPFFLQYSSSHPFMIFIPSILFLYYTSYWETSFPFYPRFSHPPHKFSHDLFEVVFNWVVTRIFLYVKTNFIVFNFVSLLDLFCDSLS